MTPGSDNDEDSAMGSVEDGVYNGKMNYSGQAAKDRAQKRNKQNKQKDYKLSFLFIPHQNKMSRQ